MQKGRSAYKILGIALLVCFNVIVYGQQTKQFENPEQLFQKGLQLFQKEKYGAAKTLFEEYLTIEQETLKASSASYYIAISSLYLEQPNAENKIISFAKNNSEHPKAVFAFYELGNFYYQRKKYDKVINTFEEVDADLLSFDQKNDMRFKLGYSYFSKKKFDRAKTLFDRIKNQKHHYKTAATYYSGYIAFQNKDYSSAYTDFMNIVDDPSYGKIVKPNIVKILYKQEKYKELIDFTDKKKLKDSESNLYVAESYFFNENFSLAKKHYGIYFKNRSRAADEVNYRYGYTLLKNNDYAEASEYFKKSALLDDELGQNSAYNLGICYLKTNQKGYALGAFLHASDLEFDKKIQEEALISYAKLNYENKNYQEAIRTLEQLNEKFPSSKHYKENEELLTDAYVNSNNYKQAVSYLEKIKNKSHREKLAYQKATYKLGVENYNNSKFEEGLVNFEKSLKYPYDKKFLLAASFWTAETYARGKQYNEAIKFYSRIFENDPLKTSTYYLRTRYGIGYAYYNTKQYSKALNHFKYYVINNKASSKSERLYVVDATTRLADCYYVTKDYNSAINEYKQVKAQQSLHLDYASFQLSILEYSDGRIEESKKHLDEIINEHKDSPFHDDALFQRALIDLETGAYASAVAGFSDLIDYKPNHKLVPLAYSKRALAYGNLNKYNEELDDYLYVLDHYITNPIAHKIIEGLSNSLAKVGREEEFNAYLEKYKKANPNDTELSAIEFEAAKTLYFNQKYETAIVSLNNYISSYGGTAQAYEGQYYLAESYRKTNQMMDAVATYEKVIAANKSEYIIRSIYKAAEIYYDEKKYENAIKKYLQLGERANTEKDNVKSYRGLMRSYYHIEDCSSAIANAKQLLASGFTNDDLRDESKLTIGKCNIKQDNIEEANKTLKEIVESNSGVIGAEANYLLAKIQYDAGEYDHSIEVLHAMNKSYANIDYWIGMSYLLISKNLIAKEEDFQAKATLNSIIQYSKIEEIVGEAQKLLDKLEDKVNKDKIESDSLNVITIDSLENE